MKFSKLILFIGLFSISFSQLNIEYTKYGDFRWEISLDHMIVYLNNNYSEDQLNFKLAELNGKVVTKLNSNNFYLIQFRNLSKTEIIFEKQIAKIKNISFVKNLIPVMRFSEKISNVDQYANSDISGFSTVKNDSIFATNLNMRLNFISCYNKEFRNQPKFVRYIYVNYSIENGETKNLRVLETDMENEYLDCIKRVIINQKWQNIQYKGRASFFYIVYTDK